jgi:hypothetical protein
MSIRDKYLTEAPEVNAFSRTIETDAQYQTGRRARRDFQKRSTTVINSQVTGGRFKKTLNIHYAAPAAL